MSPHALSLTPASTALVTVECQNGIIGLDGALPDLAAAAAPIVPEIRRLAEAVRQAGGPVVHLTFVPALDNRSSNRRPVLFNTVLPAMGDWTLEHPAAQVLSEIG
ncbi:MAG TPA: isochorismatase family protein, partial [Acidimicrobiales bacterium]|nr:isochorismatase family protein [Acidimicrobiales bacterium]